MAKQTGEQIAQDSTTEALARSGEAANEIMKGNADSRPRAATPQERPFRS